VSNRSNNSARVQDNAPGHFMTKDERSIAANRAVSLLAAAQEEK
jgi:hypothetical protein